MNITSIFRTYLTSALFILFFLAYNLNLNGYKINPNTFNWGDKNNRNELALQFCDNLTDLIAIAFGSRESEEISNKFYILKKGECIYHDDSKSISYLIKPIDETLNNFINNLMKLMKIILDEQNNHKIPILFNLEALKYYEETTENYSKKKPDKIRKENNLTIEKTKFICGKGQATHVVENIYNKFEQCIVKFKNVLEIMNNFASKYNQFKKIHDQTQVLLEQIEEMKNLIDESKQSNNPRPS